nr:PEP-CTERM sorting domain-containing protein [Xylophilus rhododendri]
MLEGIGPTGTVTTIVVGAVPEPETGAMLLAGLGAMAMVMRRRRRR